MAIFHVTQILPDAQGDFPSIDLVSNIPCFVNRPTKKTQVSHAGSRD
jgi:hypothetical protein